MKKVIKELEFTEVGLPCYPPGTAYGNDKYRVVHYDVLLSGFYCERTPHWRAYTEPNGNYVETEHTVYDTREEAEKACINHAARLS